MPFDQSPKRDYKHMRTVLDTIMTVWYKYPELRLGQLLECSISYSGTPKAPVFYVEDKELMVALNKFSDENQSTESGGTADTLG